MPDACGIRVAAVLRRADHNDAGYNGIQ